MDWMNNMLVARAWGQKQHNTFLFHKIWTKEEDHDDDDGDGVFDHSIPYIRGRLVSFCTASQGVVTLSTLFTLTY